VHCLEVRHGAPATIRAARGVDGLLVGAGNVLDAERAELAARAGAQFATAPGTNMGVVHACRELELPFFPGVATPSEIERLTSVGVTAMGVFPIAALGGPPYLEAIASAYPDVMLVPQGGVRAEALRAYLAVPSVLAVTCDWIVRQDLVRAAGYERIERHAREARASAAHRHF
jgi:2-dehydro-3-deoxyphosphogluconate aldolase/(4S)-4-hydroxy-2-oxoglutarate aldolase